MSNYTVEQMDDALFVFKARIKSNDLGHEYGIIVGKLEKISEQLADDFMQTCVDARLEDTADLAFVVKTWLDYLEGELK